MIEELSPENLTSIERIRLGQHVREKHDWPEDFDPDHFFPMVRKWMELGIAKAWGCPDGLLVALFTENVFTASKVASVLCWWSKDNARGSIAMLEAFEAEAKKRACKHIYVSAFGVVRAKAVERLYRRWGYKPHESIFLKTF